MTRVAVRWPVVRVTRRGVRSVAEVGMGHDAAHRGRLDRSPGWCVFVQAEMRAGVMVRGEGGGERAPQVSFVPDDHVVETLPTKGSDQPLRVGIVPRRARRRAPIEDTETGDATTDELVHEEPIAIV